MSLSPHHPGVGACEIRSPDIFMSGVRCNLDSQLLNARDSTVKEENMCVYARIRPVLPQEIAKGFKVCIVAVDDETVRTVVPITSSRYKNSRQTEEIVEDFSYSEAFGPESGQFVFFQETMLTTMQNFVEGGNSLVFNYGITGSGKTYTLQGNAENPGIIPLSLRLYFASVEKQLMKEIKVKPHMYNNIITLSAAERKAEYYAKKELLSLYDDECDIILGSSRNSNNKTFAMTLCDLFSDDYEAEERQTTLGPEDMASAQAATLMKETIRNSAENQLGVCNVWVSFVEIYNENIFDLLQPFSTDRKRLMLRECNGNTYIEGAREICVSNGDEALKLLNIGRKQLSIASTKMNYQSSRSHCIYTIRVVRVRDINNLSHGRVNRLSFCDLAGSERAAKTQTSGIRLKEAGSINTSLLVLGRCLEQLRMNQMGRDKRLIPFRDSKLTRIFSGFFMGQGKAVMIANASPCDYTYDETFHVLKFSALARKLKVNDTFFSEASSVLQSVCNEWSNTSNRSLCNDSTESLDTSDDITEIIQKKDEIIEKLIQLAEKLTKKEQDMADMEMRIRQEVYREYSEYSDQLLEENRIMYEEQIDAVRENYKKMLANRDKMYEKIIKDLNETVDSNDDTFNDDSIVDLENPESSSLGQSFQKNTVKLKEAYQSQNSELKELQSSLESVNAELEKTKQELLESQKLVTNLDIELNTCKDEKEKLSNECKHYQNAASTAKELTKKYEVDIKDLEDQLSYLRKELNATKELCQNKEFSFHEMKSENEVLKNKSDMLEKDVNELKDTIERYDADTKDYETKIGVLKDKLLCSENNCALVQEQLQVKLSLNFEIKKENEVLKNKSDMLEKEVNELKDTIERYDADTKDYDTKIGVLKDKLLCSENNHALVQEQLQMKLSLNSEIEKENEGLKNKVDMLGKEVNELKDIIERHEADTKDYETKIGVLEEKLLCSEKNHALVEEKLHRKLSFDSEIEKENEVLKNKVDMLEKEVNELKDVIERNDANSKDYKTKIGVLEEKLLCSENNHALVEEQLRGKLCFDSEIEKENEVLKRKVEMLEKEVKELKDLTEKYDADTKDYESKIGVLEDKLLCSEKNHSLIQEQLQVKLSSDSEIEKELKGKIVKLEKEVGELNNINTKSETTVKFLEERLQSTQVALGTAEDQMEVCSARISGLEKEIETYKNEMTLFEKKSSEASERLKEVMEENDSKGQNFEQVISSLKKELSNANKELEKNFLCLEELLSEIEVDGYSGQDDSKVQRNSKEFLHRHSSYESITEKLKEKISILQQELKVANKNTDLISKEMKVRETVSAELEKEIDMYKQEIESLKLKLSEKVELKEKLLSVNQELKSTEVKSEMENMKQKEQHLISEKCDLQEKLVLAESELEDLKNDVQQKIENVKLEMEKMKQKEESLISEKSELQEKLSLAERELEVLKNEVQQKSSYEQNIQNVKLEMENMKLKEQHLISEKSDLQEKLVLAESELEDLKNDVQQKIENVKLELENMKQKEEHLISEKSDLQEKLVLAESELENLKNDVQQKIENVKLEMEKMKQKEESLISEKSELQEKLTLAERELEVLKNEVQQKSSYEQNIQNVKLDIEKRKQKEQSLISEKSELQTKLALAVRELEVLKDDIQQKSSNEQTIQNVKSEMENMKQKEEHLISEKSDLQEKLVLAESELEDLKNDVQQKIENVKLEMEKMKQKEESLISEKSELQEKLALAERELEVLRNEVQQKSSFEQNIQNVKLELENMKQKEEHLISEKSDLQEKLVLAESELENLKNDVQQKIENVKLEMEKMKQKEESLISEKSELQEKLALAERELEVLKNEVQQKSSFEQNIQNVKLEMENMKQKEESLISEKSDLQEKLGLAESELEDLKNDVKQKIQNVKLEMEKMKQKEESLISEKSVLQEKLVLAETELDVLKNDVQQKSSHEQKIENEINVYKEQICKLEKDYENLHSEKRKAEEDVQCYKEKLERNSLNVLKDGTATSNLNKLAELEKEILVYKHDIKKMKDCQKLNEEEKQDLMIVISANEEKIEDLEDKLTAVNEELLAAKDDILARTSATGDLENRVAQLYVLIEILEKCEARASNRIEMIQTTIQKHRSKVMDLHCQIRNKESSIDELEKALCNCQEQLKNVQRSCDQKLVSEKEQHEIEIEQTIKLKHLVEEENMSLKKQKQKSSDLKKRYDKKENPSKKKSDGKTENPPKKNVEKGKENVPKYTSSRMKRKKEVDLKELSFSSIDSSTEEKNQQRGRKRLSDEDFDPCPDRASKKRKPAESSKASKIPVTRTTRKRLQPDKTENLSPIQKITNSITSKVRVLSSNISSQISTPRLTRGRKRLFNPEAASSSNKGATKGKKT